MLVKNKFSRSVWKKEEKKFIKLKTEIKIPNKSLYEVDSVILKKESDFDRIPDIGGCYWIWTNERVNHRFHKHKIPDRIKAGEVIYNGIAKDNVRIRVKRHLLGKPEAGWSGISLDIYHGKSRSHRKKVFSTNKKVKVPYVSIGGKLQPIRKRNLVFELNLSRDERNFVQKRRLSTYFFRNGINIFDRKHRNFTFKIYFIAGVEPLYLEYIEKRWRERFGLPKLCSYSSGR